jgi:hypothetical protein
MAKSLNIVKDVCIKRRSVIDTQYSCGKPRPVQSMKSLSSTSSLNSMLSELSVKKTYNKRLWKGLGPRRKHSRCLVTLLEETKRNQRPLPVPRERVPIQIAALAQLAPTAPSTQPLKHLARQERTPSFGCSFEVENFQDAEDSVHHPIEF